MLSRCRTIKRILGVPVLGALLLSAQVSSSSLPGSGAHGQSSGTTVITIGAAANCSLYIISEMVRLVLIEEGHQASHVSEDYGESRLAARQALLKGDVMLVPEFTGYALRHFFGEVVWPTTSLDHNLTYWLTRAFDYQSKALVPDSWTPS